jgi:four helix bundle protein
MPGHRSLIAWQKAMDLVVAIYSAGRVLRSAGHADLARQMERAAVSVPANVAEGYGRSSPKEMARFLDISMGSLREVDTFVEVADRVGLLKPEMIVDLASRMDEVGRVIFGLRRKARAVGAAWRSSRKLRPTADS